MASSTRALVFFALSLLLATAFAHDKPGYGSPPRSGHHSPPRSGHHSPPRRGHHSPPRSGYDSPPSSGYDSPPRSGYDSPPTSGYGSPPRSVYDSPPPSSHQYSPPPSVPRRGVPHIPPTPLMFDICKKCPHYDLCIFALTSNPLAGKCDIWGLASVSIEGTIRMAAQIEILINGHLNRFYPEVLQNRIRDCSRLYDDANAQLHVAFTSLMIPFGGGKEKCIAALTAAMANADKCEQGCQSQQFESGLLTSKNIDFKMYCSNSIEIIKQLP